MTTDSNAETHTTTHETNTTQHAKRPKSRRIRKLPAREIIDAEFINPNSSKTFNELLLTKNVSTQNRTILSELWGASNYKTPLPPITIGSPRKSPLQSVNSVVTNKLVDSHQIKKTIHQNAFELNVIIPPSLMKHKENKLKDTESEDDGDTMSMAGDFDVNFDSLETAINERQTTVEKDISECEITMGKSSHDNETILEKDDSAMEQDKNSTPKDNTTTEDVIEDTTDSQDNANTENDDADTSDVKDGDVSTDGNETLKIDLVSNEETDGILKENNESNDATDNDDILEEEVISNDDESLTDTASLNEATDESAILKEDTNEADTSVNETQESNDEPALDIDQQIIIPQNTKLHNESKSPVIVIERMNSIEDDIDKIWPTMDDNDSSTDESWLKMSDIEEEDDDAVYKLISDVTVKRKRPHTQWIVNGRPRPDPTVGCLRKQRLADKLEQPYIIRKKIKSSWICK